MWGGPAVAFGHPSFGEFAAGWAEETWQKLGVCRLSTAIPKKMEKTFAILYILYTSYKSFCLEKKAIGPPSNFHLAEAQPDKL